MKTVLVAVSLNCGRFHSKILYAYGEKLVMWVGFLMQNI